VSRSPCHPAQGPPASRGSRRRDADERRPDFVASTGAPLGRAGRGPSGPTVDALPACGDGVYALLVALRAVARHHVPEVGPAAAAYLGRSDEPEPITREALRARVRAARSRCSTCGQAPSTRRVTSRAPCRSRSISCPGRSSLTAAARFRVMAPQGIELLRAHGLPARRLEDGLPEWRLAGYPVAVGLD
jgi:hypothetical protein